MTTGRSAIPVAAKPTGYRRVISLGLSILGMVLLAFLLGAAAMYFDVPPSTSLRKAFLGARAWNERRQVTSSHPNPEPPPATIGAIDRPEKTFDGFTLYACASLSVSGTQVFLVDMRGNVVHRWAVPFSRVWPDPPHLQGRVDDALVCIFSCHLYPNGDLLVVFHGEEKNSVNGYGLAKLDRDSNVVWRYPANVHHDVDVGEDGTIYAIRHDMVQETPKGFEDLSAPFLVDSLVLLSPDGKELRKPIPLLEAFRDTPYASLLAPLERRGKHRVPEASTVPRILDDVRREDPLHANSVQVLTREKAAKFPGFKAGQVLLSLRNLHTIALLDVEKGSMVWAARGPWRAQHDAQFLDNGHLLIFDNLGSPRGSRVLEYDPQTQGFPWSYSGENGVSFFTSERGMSQRLPNGNTLIVSSEPGQFLEVTPDKELVWTFSTNQFITTARRYDPNQLQFLKGDQRARP